MPTESAMQKASCLDAQEELGRHRGVADVPFFAKSLRSAGVRNTLFAV